MAWRGSISRSIISTARASTFRSTPALPRLRPPPLSAPRLRPRRLSFANPRTMGELGCAQSLMPLYSMGAGARLTSHLTASLRACCELSHGMEKMGDVSRNFEHPMAGVMAALYLNILLDEHNRC